MEQTLLLNATYEPLRVIDWQRAMVLWAQQKVEVLEEHDREVRAVSFAFRLPAVVRLLRFVRIRQRRDYVPFTRANIYARDGHRCQYCGETKDWGELTFDHVVPAAQGGRRTWDNIVTACVACNTAKAARTPKQAGMHLMRAPHKPASTPTFRLTLGLRQQATWKDWLYWNVEIEA